VNLRSLHLRLLIAFALVLVPAWALFAALAVGGARAYFEELTQRQNALLASNLVAEAAAKGDDVLSDDVVDMLAMANPGVEIYVLDVDGRVMAPPVGVELTNAAVDLAPIERFVATTGDGTLRPLPIRGTDPRGPRPVVFSAAPLDDGSGYLYVVLTDAPRSTLAGSIGGSATLGLVVGGGALGLLVAIGAGSLVFALLTRRLRAVADGVRAYDPKRPEVLTVRAPARPAGDEVDDVASGVGALMERVRDQVAELAAVDAARRELVTNVSHDLRTPLTALHAALEASTLADHDPAQRAWLLDTASRHAQRLGRLVERLFEYSTLDEANPPLERETFPLDELVDDVVQKHLPRAEGLGLDLAVVGAPSIDGAPAPLDGARPTHRDPRRHRPRRARALERPRQRPALHARRRPRAGRRRARGGARGRDGGRHRHRHRPRGAAPDLRPLLPHRPRARRRGERARAGDRAAHRGAPRRRGRGHQRARRRHDRAPRPPARRDALIVRDRAVNLSGPSRDATGTGPRLGSRCSKGAHHAQGPHHPLARRRRSPAMMRPRALPTLALVLAAAIAWSAWGPTPGTTQAQAEAPAAAPTGRPATAPSPPTARPSPTSPAAASGAPRPTSPSCPACSTSAPATWAAPARTPPTSRYRATTRATARSSRSSSTPPS
jgi:hypothetical protein